jgi:hypothetical protein
MEQFAGILVDACICGFGFTFANRIANSMYNKLSNKWRKRKINVNSSFYSNNSDSNVNSIYIPDMAIPPPVWCVGKKKCQSLQQTIK